MPNHRVFIGIDFGTTNSSIAYVLADPRDEVSQTVVVRTVSVVSDEERGSKSDRVPTILAAELDKRRRGGSLLGWEFVRRVCQPRRKGHLIRHGETFFRSVKSDLGSHRVYPHAFSPDYDTPEKVAAAIFARLLKEAKRCLPEYNLARARVVVSVPASLSALGRQQTKEAVLAAGLQEENIELIDEPVAALLDFLNHGRAAGLLDASRPKNLLVFDYGGGTLDLSLVRAAFDPQNAVTGLRVENLAISQYRRLGGDDIDRAVMQRVVWPQIEVCSGLRRESLRPDLRQSVEDTLIPTVARELKERICRKITDIRDGKEFAGPRGRVSCVAARPGNYEEEMVLPGQFLITADEFEKVMIPFLTMPRGELDEKAEGETQSLLVPVMDVLARAGISELDLDAVILHGGSCRNPLVRELLKESFGRTDTLFHNAQILETPDLEASVARGAAIAGFWRHERGIEMVPPIIAEEIGILTLDDKPVQLLKSGAPLPFPDGDGVYLVPAEFFVPRQGQRQMLVPFYSGRRSTRISGVIRVDLPVDVKSGTRVAIKVRVERDKTLHWWFNLDGGQFRQAPSLQDPWTARTLSPPERELLGLRRQIRETLLRFGSVPAVQERAEGGLLMRCGHLEEAEVVLQDILRHHGPDAGTLNLLGLVTSQKGDQKAAVEWHRKAIEASPKDAVLIGNYGYMLADLGQAEAGEARMREALGLNPDLGYLYERLGDLYRSRGDEGRATQEYAEALRLVEREALAAGATSRSWWTAARMYQKVGNYQRVHEARGRAEHLARNEWLGGEHELRIAGPDSGFLSSSDTSSGN